MSHINRKYRRGKDPLPWEVDCKLKDKKEDLEGGGFYVSLEEFQKMQEILVSNIGFRRYERLA